VVCPPVVRRALVRVVVGVCLALALVSVAGGLWAQARVGATADDTRARIERDTRARLTRLSAGLDRAAQDIAGAGALVEAAAGGDASSLGRLFTNASVDADPARRDVAALTVYGPEGTPLAWDGRPSPVPAARLNGVAATFILPTPQGLRLARLLPIAAADGTRRRIGTVVAEAIVTDTGTGEIGTWESDLAPVTLAPILSSPAAGSFEVQASDGTVLGAGRIAPDGVARARQRAWQRVAVWLWTTGAVGAALFWAPLVLWRRLVGSTPGFLATTATLAAATVASWAMARRALALAAPAGERDWHALAAAAAGLALASLFAVAVGRARAAGWFGRGHRRRRWRSRLACGVVGSGIGIVAAWHTRGLPALANAGGGSISGTLTPLETGQAVAAVAFVLAHAAAALLVVALARAAIAVLGRLRRSIGGADALVTAVTASLAAIAASQTPAAPDTSMVVALVLVGMTVAFDRATRTLRRGSQPARLLVLMAALAVPALGAYPALAFVVTDERRDVVVREIAPQVADQRQGLQAALREALDEIWTTPDLVDLVRASPPPTAAPPPDAAFLLWSRTALATRRLTSSVELYDRAGRLVSRFALNLPEVAVDQRWQEAGCDWELFEEVSPFFAEERRLLHAGRGICENGTIVGALVVHVVLDYANLPFLAAQQPYVAVVGSVQAVETTPPRDDIAFAVYGWSRRPLFSSGGEAWTLPETLLARLVASRDPFWATLERQGVTSDVFFTSDRGAIYAIGYPRLSRLAHLSNLAELVALTAVVFVALLAAVSLGSRVGGAAALSGRALFRDVRASFSRTLFLAFVAAVVVPVVALALVTRAYMATTLRQDIEREATRTVLSASRVVEDFAAIEARGATNLPALDDSLLVWLSRVIGEDINVFAGPGLLASSERNLFASGLLATRTPGDTYRALVIDGQPTFLARETVAGYEYQVASALVRVADQQAIVSVPLTLRQQSIERQIDELDRRVLLAAIGFILLGSAIGYWAAERISDPVSRLTRATRRLAAGDLDAHVLVRTSDELGRLVAAFNGMAEDLRQQRAALERTNRLEAWAEMARQVAHDIKNPLTPVQLNAEHLRRVHADQGRPLGAVVDECVTNILLQVRLLRQLASEFSSFASAPEARPTATPVQPLLDEILSPYAQALAGRIDIAISVREPLSLHADRVLLARALTNVIENALHAMPGQGTLTVSARVDADGRGRIDVTDTGVGMDEAAQARIFEPYFSTKATGTGLGLTIARRNVELNGGTIAVTSAPGLGTTVSLWLPIHAASDAGSDGAVAGVGPTTVPGAAAR
jgi:signal transduction histidine kinase